MSQATSPRVAQTRVARLPDGFGVRIDPRVRKFAAGRVLIGGSPTRMLKLAPAAAAMIEDGYLRVVDSRTAAVARRLLDSGVGNPRPTALPSSADVTVVIPVKDNPAGLRRLLQTTEGLEVIVVDDGSDVPVVPPARGRVRVLRHEDSRGPAAARNTGLREATTQFVAFLDSDVVPRTGWLEAMLGHFSDPAVALVAPRIVALDPDNGALARYEHSRSSLDLGRREAPVVAGGPVSYVPSAAMIVRRDALAECGGFDESMQVAEDVDLCWRLQHGGWRLRYEPIARVAHDHRVRFRNWLVRKAFYGTGAAPLAARHPASVPPMAMSIWTLIACLAVAGCTRLGVLGALVSQVVTLVRLRRMFTELDHPTRIAMVLTAQSFAGGLWQLASAVCRHYWPLTLVASLFSSKVRRAAVAFAVAEGIWDWYGHREDGGLDPVRFVLYKRLDDLAYGAGLWKGAFDARDAAALVPDIRT
ncbi:mycofactocin biosynthesis glycosyltransferase MftF [Rhodococcus chondri]|uniref:Mycofactocin biosynthesis glycosyltransferase MftF n=1 Tax=Rhodococcus chondri TaxID=3065941 RepID=A0ABU7JPS0_9NOCA|nr:mycofactocin biosynthesis glycosyltransferase MftF [Rhodococcus sp. CC-R104]MEE2031810.1 mycofactocin biosynthesis glycosyltransferase MftF [Rhodococcus sp. CC-R104]